MHMTDVLLCFVVNRCWHRHCLYLPGPRFNIKMSSYQYRKSHCGDKTVVRSSYLHNVISYTGKMASLYWFSPLVYFTSTGAIIWWTGYQIKQLWRVRVKLCESCTFVSSYHNNNVRPYTTACIFKSYIKCLPIEETALLAICYNKVMQRQAFFFSSGTILFTRIMLKFVFIIIIIIIIIS